MCRDRVLIGLIVVVDQRHSASRRRQNGLSLTMYSVDYNMYRLRSTVSFSESLQVNVDKMSHLKHSTKLFDPEVLGRAGQPPIR